VIRHCPAAGIGEWYVKLAVVLKCFEAYTKVWHHCDSPGIWNNKCGDTASRCIAEAIFIAVCGVVLIGELCVDAGGPVPQGIDHVQYHVNAARAKLKVLIDCHTVLQRVEFSRRKFDTGTDQQTMLPA